MQNIKFRPVTTDDNLTQIARLIYRSNIETTKLWQPTEYEFAQAIAPWLYVENFPFYYKNLCIATECNDRFPIAIISGLDSKPRAPLDYSLRIFNDEKSDHIIKEYVRDILALRSFLSADETIITSLCVETAVQSHGIGQGLLSYYMQRMQKRGTKVFRLDCTTDNDIVMQLCEKYGFRPIGEKINPFNSEGARIITYAL